MRVSLLELWLLQLFDWLCWAGAAVYALVGLQLGAIAATRPADDDCGLGAGLMGFALVVLFPLALISSLFDLKLARSRRRDGLSMTVQTTRISMYAAGIAIPFACMVWTRIAR